MLGALISQTRRILVLNVKTRQIQNANTKCGQANSKFDSVFVCVFDVPIFVCMFNLHIFPIRIGFHVPIRRVLTNRSEVLYFSKFD